MEREKKNSIVFVKFGVFNVYFCAVYFLFWSDGEKKPKDENRTDKKLNLNCKDWRLFLNFILTAEQWRTKF